MQKIKKYIIPIVVVIVVLLVLFLLRGRLASLISNKNKDVYVAPPTPTITKEASKTSIVPIAPTKKPVKK